MGQTAAALDPRGAIAESIRFRAPGTASSAFFTPTWQSDLRSSSHRFERVMTEIESLKYAKSLWEQEASSLGAQAAAFPNEEACEGEVSEFFGSYGATGYTFDDSSILDEPGPRGRSKEKINLTSLERRVQREYQHHMERIQNDGEDGTHRSYEVTGAMIEAQLRLKYEKEGFNVTDEEKLKHIFSHRRDLTPPRTGEAYGERAKNAFKKVIPISVKMAFEAGLHVLEEGARVLYHELPEGGQTATKISLSLASGMVDVFPTQVRQSLRSLGCSQEAAQDAGDLVSAAGLLLPVAGQAGRSIKVVTASRSVVEALDLGGKNLLKKTSRALIKEGEQPWNIRKGQEWKEKIFGRAQKTETKGHAFRSYREGIKAAKREDVEKVFLNRGVKKGSGHPIERPNTRPDVGFQTTDQKFHQIEVPSRSDVPDALELRMDKATQRLPEHMQGKNRIIEITKKDPQ